MQIALKINGIGHQQPLYYAETLFIGYRASREIGEACNAALRRRGIPCGTDYGPQFGRGFSGKRKASK